MGYILLGLITETGVGSGARATIQVSSGNVTQITIGLTYKGSGYQVGDTLRIDGATFLASQDLIITLQADDLNCVTTTFSTTNQFCSGVNETVLGDVPYVDYTQVEFYNGELCGSTLIATTQSLLNDPLFDPLLNNVSGSRLNSYLMEVEYNNGIVTASNNPQILNRTAKRAAVPDSNYTAKKVILPRYEGSKVSSADYNFFTSASSNAEFIVGPTGSWDGDKSYGKTAAIDVNPIYFAHFKFSWDNPVIFGMGEYFVDQLIEVPFEDIQGTSIEPKVLKIEGNNSKLQEIVSTFGVNRKLTTAYNSEKWEGVNYSSLKRTDLKILNPGSRYVLTSGNQISPTETSVSWSYSRFDGSSLLSNTISGSNGVSDILLSTGSGFLELKGKTVPYGGPPGAYPTYFFNASSFNYTTDTGMIAYGPYLSVIHTYNYCVANKIPAVQFGTPGGTVGGGVPPGINPNDPKSYFSINPGQSLLPNYENDEQPFLIERGDEIRVTYLSGSQYINQDFQVLGVESITYNAGTSESFKYVFLNTANPGYAYSGATGYNMKLYNKINVHPDPSTLTSQIPNGSIYSYTIRKRQDADNIVNVYSPVPPSGSKGAETYSGKGYIIPNDLTVTQKRNVQTLITQLKGKNNFVDDDTV
jgi:hypothetical protein